jgi:hypothetical protein
MKDYDHYINTTYSGKELIKKHSLDEYGTWLVCGCLALTKYPQLTKL